MSDERFVLDQPASNDIHQQHLARYRFAGSFIQGKRVIDVACGTGYGSAMLADLGAAHVVGVDVSAESIEGASRTWRRQNVQFQRRDALTIDQLEPVDVAVSFETIEHLERPEEFLEAVRRVLLPGGQLLVSTPERRKGSIHDKPDNPFHVREWTREEFVELLKRHFGTVTVHGQYAMVKRAYPLSMTLQRLIAGVLHPETKDTLYSFPVLGSPPPVGGFRMMCVYMVAVCRQPLPKGST